MSGGRPRKPRQLKVIEGTFRKDRNPGKEPEVPPVTQVPRPPAGLNRWARRMWRELTPIIVDNGVLGEVDLPAWEACCQQYGIYRELYDAITHTYDETGKRVRRSIAEYLAGQNSQTIPEYTAMNKAFAQMNTYLQQFGLTPASRNRIDLKGGQADEDPMEALLNEA